MRELSQAELDELIEEAIVDAYGEDEPLVGSERFTAGADGAGRR